MDVYSFQTVILGSDVMHGVEHVLVHRVDDKTVFSAQRFHFFDKARKFDRDAIDLHDHDHGKVFIENALRNIDDVRLILRTCGGYLCDDADNVLACYLMTAFIVCVPFFPWK